MKLLAVVLCVGCVSTKYERRGPTMSNAKELSVALQAPMTQEDAFVAAARVFAKEWDLAAAYEVPGVVLTSWVLTEPEREVRIEEGVSYQGDRAVSGTGPERTSQSRPLRHRARVVAREAAIVIGVDCERLAFGAVVSGQAVEPFPVWERCDGVDAMVLARARRMLEEIVKEAQRRARLRPVPQ